MKYDGGRYTCASRAENPEIVPGTGKVVTRPRIGMPSGAFHTVVGGIAGDNRIGRTGNFTE